MQSPVWALTEGSGQLLNNSVTYCLQVAKALNCEKPLRANPHSSLQGKQYALQVSATSVVSRLADVAAWHLMLDCTSRRVVKSSTRRSLRQIKRVQLPTGSG